MLILIAAIYCWLKHGGLGYGIVAKHPCFLNIVAIRLEAVAIRLPKSDGLQKKNPDGGAATQLGARMLLGAPGLTTSNKKLLATFDLIPYANAEHHRPRVSWYGNVSVVSTPRVCAKCCGPKRRRRRGR